MQDATALQVFVWCMLQVDKKTGKFTCGRFIGAQELNIKPSTFRDAIYRLRDKYKIIDTSSDNRRTEISLLNWTKYNDYGKPTTPVATSRRHIDDTKATHIQDNKTKDIKTNNNILDAKRPLSEEQKQYYRITDHLQKMLNMKITTWAKQFKAIKSIIDVGYTELQIIKTIDYMANKDDFYSDKGFDMTTVAKQISLYKAKMRKVAIV